MPRSVRQVIQPFLRRPRPIGSNGPVIPFAAALFLSAALLFLVQPMAARSLLPVLGGTPAVWTGALLFFQTLLLAGYAYAHLLSSRLALRRQILLHASVLLAPAAAFVLLEAPPSSAASSSPVLWLLAALALTAGPGFFALSTTSSLLQRWFSRADPRDPYALYAASNLGSLAGLLVYPLAVEPLLGLQAQRQLWAWGYGFFVLSAGVCAVRAWGAGAEELPPPRERVAWRERIRWTLLAALPSSLLLGVTQHLTTDLAPFPFLWVLPLAFYLLSWVATFAPRPLIPPRAAQVVQACLLLPLAGLLPWESDLQGLALPLVLPLHAAAFFATSLVCHGELAARRPPAGALTEFYLCLALGGALGGAFNALAAPLLFVIPLEYPLALVASSLGRGRRGSMTGAPTLKLLAALAVVVVLTLAQRWMLSRGAAEGVRVLPAAGALLLAPLLWDGPKRLAAGVGALLLFGALGADRGLEVLHRDRSFFGAHRVERTPEGRRFLVHGRILHGAQEEAEGRRRLPLSYYHRRGPCGRMFLAFASRIPGGRVGAVGLGTGTLAAYGLPGQRWTFYEIDRAVERTARRWFTYLADSPARVEVEIGDGRLGLERAAAGEFGLIVLDAFSSDAVPVHLLTREALDVYMGRLAPGGIAAFHVSNRFVDLVAVLSGHAARGGWAGLVADEAPLPAAEESDGRARSTWVLLAKRAAELRAFVTDEIWEILPQDAEAPAWTDAHSSVLPLLKLR